VYDNEMWDGFAGAVVRLELSGGVVLLEPRPPGDIGVFPFDGPVHIVTAYNPAGLEIDEETNRARHRALGLTVAGLATIPTVGSAPDGSMPEPGFALLQVSLGDALDLARDFGQLAIYRWTFAALDIIGVDEPHRRRLGWSVSEER
jgi:hypothetical protein